MQNRIIEDEVPHHNPTAPGDPHRAPEAQGAGQKTLRTAIRNGLQLDIEPASATTLPRLYAFADTTSPDAYNLRLYHCPTDPQEELRLTWDAIRHQHAGYCKACRKLWPLPRRTITREQLQAALALSPVEPEEPRTP